MVTISFKMRYVPVSFLFVLDYSMNEKEQADWDNGWMSEPIEEYDDTDYDDYTSGYDCNNGY